MTPRPAAPGAPLPLRRAAGWSAALLLLSRLWVALFVYLGHSQRAYQGPVEGGWIGVDQWWLNPWTTYDSLHYMTIATVGYQSLVEAAFFPLYPLLLRLAGSSPLLITAWGLLLSTLALWGALTALYLLTEAQFGTRGARDTVLVAAFWLTSAYFSALYTESLFFFLLTWAFLAAHRRRWVAAGLLGGLAGLTRNSGFLITLALLIAYGRSLPDWRRTRPVELAALFLPVVAFGGVQLYLATRFSSIASSIATQQNYGRALTWPWLPLWNDLKILLTLDAIDATSPFTLFLSTLTYSVVDLTNFAATILALALMVRYRRTLPPSYLFLTVGILALHLTYARTVAPYSLAAARYLSTTFPFAIALALALGGVRRRARWAVAPLLAAYLLLGALSSYLFGMKLFLG